MVFLSNEFPNHYLPLVPPHVHALEAEALGEGVRVNEVLLALRRGGKPPLTRLQQALEHLLRKTFAVTGSLQSSVVSSREQQLRMQRQWTEAVPTGNVFRGQP